MTSLSKSFLDQNKIGTQLLFAVNLTQQLCFKGKLFRAVVNLGVTELLDYTVNEIIIFFGLDW